MAGFNAQHELALQTEERLDRAKEVVEALTTQLRERCRVQPCDELSEDDETQGGEEWG